MTALAAVYWAGVLFALGIGIALSQGVSEENPVLSLLLLILFAVVSLLSWIAAGIFIGAILVNVANKMEEG